MLKQEEEHMNNTNTKLKIGALAVIAGLYSTGAVAETADGTAVATVVAPIVINNFTTMDFASLAGGTSGGTMAVDNAGALTPSGTVVAITGAGSELGFDITGEPLLMVDVSFSAANLSNGTPADDMALAVDAVASFALAAGANSIVTGGTLTVAGAQAAGSYTTGGGGTALPITVTVSYQ